MKNTFRDLKPGDIIFISEANKIGEGVVETIGMENIIFGYTRGEENRSKFYINRTHFDKKHTQYAEMTICINHDIAFMFQYKYNRISIKQEMVTMAQSMKAISFHLNQTRDIMNSLLDVDESIDWNDLTKED